MSELQRFDINSVPVYYVIQLLEDVESSINTASYEKGQTLLAWEDSELNCYWAANVQDAIAIDEAIKLCLLKANEL